MMDYQALAISRLTGQFENSPKLRSLVAAIVSALGDLEIASDAVKSQRWIDIAIGKQLDGLGTIVLEARQGRDDETYRRALKYRIFVNTSNGTPGDLIKGLRFLTQPGDLQYLEAYPATALLFTDGILTPPEIQIQIQDLAPAGVSTVPVAVTFGDAPFRFGKFPAPSELFNQDGNYITANYSDIQISDGSFAADGSGMGGIVPAELEVMGSYLDVGGGTTLAVYAPEHLTTLGNDMLTGVYQ